MAPKSEFVTPAHYSDAPIQEIDCSQLPKRVERLKIEEAQYAAELDAMRNKDRKLIISGVFFFWPVLWVSHNRKHDPKELSLATVRGLLYAIELEMEGRCASS